MENLEFIGGIYDCQCPYVVMPIGGFRLLLRGGEVASEGSQKYLATLSFDCPPPLHRGGHLSQRINLKE